MPSCLKRAAADEQGQDLIEYALLSALIGLVSVAVWGLIETRLGNAYSGYDANTQAIWASPDPGGS